MAYMTRLDDSENSWLVDGEPLMESSLRVARLIILPHLQQQSLHDSPAFSSHEHRSH